MLFKRTVHRIHRMVNDIPLYSLIKHCFLNLIVVMIFQRQGMPVGDMTSSSLVPPSLRAKTTILDRSLSKGKQEVSLAAFALLFSETVQYCQARSSTVPELQGKLHDLGWQVCCEFSPAKFTVAFRWVLAS